MKKFSTLLVLLFVCCLSSYSQSNKILDSNINWDNPKTLTVYLSELVVSGAVTVKLGTSYGASNVLNATYTVGSNITVTDNMLVIDLSSISPGAYYVDLSVTLPDASPLQMQYQCLN